ncbi:MAG: hypothetical protein PHV45_08180 [Desulfuromonas thiophila]|nr:hypothetical protein [Desulfuromonas thiophila]
MTSSSAGKLSRAKVQIELSSGLRKRGRPSHISKFLEAQRDLFPVELAVACWAPHLIPGAADTRMSRKDDAKAPAPIGEPRAAEAAPAAEGAGPLGKSIRITLSTAPGKRGVSA